MAEIFINVKVTLESIENKTYECCDCHLDFGSDQSLKKHILQKHYELPLEKTSKISYRFSCPVLGCRRNLKMNGEYFSSRKLLSQHFQKVKKIKIV